MASAEKALIEEKELDFQGVDVETYENNAHMKDTKFSWFVCSCTFISQVFVLGVLHAFGVFFVEFVREFNSPKGEAAWIGSLAYGLSMTFGPVTSLLITRFGYSRVMMAGGVTCSVALFASSFATSVPVLFFSFSVLYGIGTCMATSPTMTIMGVYFDKHLSIAMGITVSGSSFGTLIMGPLSQAIIDVGGWRLAFRVFAGLTLIPVVMNSRIRPLTPTPTATAQKQTRNILHDLQIWKNRVFVVWTLSITLVMFGFYIPYVHLVSYALDQGVSADKASYLIMILGATTAVGRIAFGRIVQIGVLNRLHMHQLSMLVTGVGVMMLPVITSYAGIVMYVITVGLVDGCYVVLLPILTTSLVGIENSVLAWGFMIGTCSITFTLGPPVAGALYDSTGSYNIAFHCAGIPIVAGALLLFLIPWAQRTSGSGPMLHTLNEYTVQESTMIDAELMRSDSHGTMRDGASSVALSTCSRCSRVTVRTTGTSPMIPYHRRRDESTSTDDEGSGNYYTLNIDDALSQLSHTDRSFDDMVRQSYDRRMHAPAPTSASSSTHSIPRIPPPSDPMRCRQTDSSRSGSVQQTDDSIHSSVQSHHSVSSSFRERPGVSQSSYPKTSNTLQTNTGYVPSSCPQSRPESLQSSVLGSLQFSMFNSGLTGTYSSGLPDTNPLNIMQNPPSMTQDQSADSSCKSGNQSVNTTQSTKRSRSPSPAAVQNLSSITQDQSAGSSCKSGNQPTKSTKRSRSPSPAAVQTPSSITQDQSAGSSCKSGNQSADSSCKSGLQSVNFTKSTKRSRSPSPAAVQNPSSITQDQSAGTSSKSGNQPKKSVKKNRSPSPAAVVKQASNFDQTISDQLTLLRETLRSPVPVDSDVSQGLTEPQQLGFQLPQINLQLATSPSPAVSTISMPQTIPSKPSIPTTPQDEDLIPGSPPPDSDRSKPPSASPQPGPSNAEDPPHDFTTDNQITIIPSTNPFKDNVKSDSERPRLKDLFLPIGSSIPGNESFELLEESAPTQDVTQDVTKVKSAGEIDVFNHLFTDE